MTRKGLEQLARRLHYRFWSTKYHPDKQIPTASEEKFKLLGNALETLTDDQKLSRYLSECGIE